MICLYGKSNKYFRKFARYLDLMTDTYNRIHQQFNCDMEIEINIVSHHKINKLALQNEMTCVRPCVITLTYGTISCIFFSYENLIVKCANHTVCALQYEIKSYIIHAIINSFRELVDKEQLDQFYFDLVGKI